jgi:VWFA-related protein
MKPSVAALVVMWLGVVAMTAEAQRPEAPAQARPVFRAGVEYVSVDVLITDDHGKPVTDLTQNDFEIREGDRVQRVLDFAHIAIPVTSRPVDLAARPAPAPDVASNVAPAPSARDVVFVIDDGAIQAGDIVKLKRVMTAFLEELAPTDRAAVVFVERSDLSQDFTSDLGQLERAVSHIDAALGWTPNARATRLSLDHVISTLADEPETRRVIVYLSGGFAISKTQPSLDAVAVTKAQAAKVAQSFTTLGLSSLIKRAQMADVPIYTLDPQGLEAPALNLGARLENQTPENRAKLDVYNGDLQDWLRTVSYGTQGLALVNTSDSSSAVAAIMRDNGSYYVLGYSPSPYAADNEFHTIDVRVLTRTGLHIRARQGYVAAPPEAPLEPGARLMAAMTNPVPGSDLALTAFAAPLMASPKGATAVVTMTVVYPKVTGDDDLHVALVAADSDGRVTASEPRTFRVPLASAAGSTGVSVVLDGAIDLPTGHWTLVVGVESQMLGQIGTVHLPVSVTDLSGALTELSPLVLGEPGDHTDVVGNAEAISLLLPIQPTTQRTFASGAVVPVFARVFTTQAATVKPELTVTRDGKAFRVVPVTVTPTPSTSGARDCTAMLDLKGLPSGDYALEFKATVGSEKLTASALGFHVQ